MKIKISSTNVSAIAAALSASCGRATSHTASAADVINAAIAAEFQLSALSLAKGLRVGATATYQSGGTVPNAYKYRRTVSRVTLARGASGWFITAVCTADVFPSAHGGVYLTLTAEQDAAVIAKVRASYSRPVGLPPTLASEVKALAELCFGAETVAHLRGYENEILPLTDAVRALAAKV
jgi:hypothetical protein